MQLMRLAKKMMKKMKEENVEVKKKDVCGNCKKDLKRSDHLRRHVKSVHEWDEEGCSEQKEVVVDGVCVGVGVGVGVDVDVDVDVEKRNPN